MKKIYEIPEVTIFEVGPAMYILNASTLVDPNSTTGDIWGNDNNLDDQSTPWYRR